MADDDITFEKKMAELSTTLYAQLAEADRIEARIQKKSGDPGLWRIIPRDPISASWSPPFGSWMRT